MMACPFHLAIVLKSLEPSDGDKSS